MGQKGRVHIFSQDRNYNQILLIANPIATWWVPRRPCVLVWWSKMWLKTSASCSSSTSGKTVLLCEKHFKQMSLCGSSWCVWFVHVKNKTTSLENFCWVASIAPMISANFLGCSPIVFSESTAWRRFSSQRLNRSGYISSGLESSSRLWLTREL